MPRLERRSHRFSDAAIELACSLTSDAEVNAKFLVADAANDHTLGEYGLITMFYLHLPIDDRASLLAKTTESLATGGTLLFVGHDKFGSTPGWSDEHQAMLTTPDKIVSTTSTLIQTQFHYGKTPMRIRCKST